MTVERYLQTIPGRELSKLHLLHEKKIWGIWGELEAPDSPHAVNPFLGVYDGTLLDAIQVALKTQNFITWGGGGIIRPVPVLK